ncbi:MAG: hypothetical protein J6X53_07265, partial [Abditibacteriota bacterium]|nr:hypothetical protein [Abditibacteriota bacterium]
ITPIAAHGVFHCVDVIQKALGKRFQGSDSAYGIAFNKTMQPTDALMLKHIPKFPDAPVHDMQNRITPKNMSFPFRGKFLTVPQMMKQRRTGNHFWMFDFGAIGTAF